MNILYINHYAGSPEMGMEFRPYYLSREWAEMGHHVTIIAGDYSHLRKKNPSVAHSFQVENIDGIEYCWVKTGSYEGNGVQRALSMERFVRQLTVNAKMIARRWKPDIVIASSTYPLDTYPAQRIAKLSGAKYIHEVHDMWPSTLYEVGGMSRKHPFVVAMQIGEDSAYKHCDKCVALLPYSEPYMREHGLAEGKFVNIQNGVVEEEWQNFQQVPEKHREFFETKKDKFIVGYCGGHAISNALDILIDTAKKTSDPDIIYVLVGDGVEKPRIMKRAEEEHVDNVYFLDPVDKRAVPDLLRYFDCSFMCGMSSPLYRFGLCLNKMYDSMMAGIPVICVYDAPETLVTQFDCGYQCSPSNLENVVKKICFLKAMPEKDRQEMGMRGHEAICAGFTYRQLARKFLENC